MPIKRPLAERFWPKVDIGEPGKCWLWTGARRPVKGEDYGSFYLEWNRLTKKRIVVTAHRVAYELTNGPIPPGMLVRHSCDTPPCCNPAHLTLGSDADNQRDKAVRGRAFRHVGTLNGRAVLTFEKATKIRTLYATKLVSHRELARLFGVSERQILRILHGGAWV